MLLCISGGDGAGKTTLIKNLQRGANLVRLEHMGYLRPRFTKQPGDTDLGNRLRSILLNGDCDFGKIEELSMLLIAIINNVNSIIVPALKDNRLVITDRFIYTTMVYQISSSIKTLEHKQLLDIMHMYFNMLTVNTPALTIILNPPPEVSLQRQTSRGLANRLDSTGLEQATMRHDGYRSIYLHSNNKNIVYIDDILTESELVERFFIILKDRDLSIPNLYEPIKLEYLLKLSSEFKKNYDKFHMVQKELDLT